MRFGIREALDVTFRAIGSMKIGNKTYRDNQPVFVIDSAKTSTIEGSATTSYATG